jgi:hypothetical protein
MDFSIVMKHNRMGWPDVLVLWWMSRIAQRFERLNTAPTEEHRLSELCAVEHMLIAGAPMVDE